MKKREFLKQSSALVTGSLVGPLISCSPDKKQNQETPEPMSNWAGNLQYSASSFFEPTTLEELRNVVVKEPQLRTLGSKHCFNKIADTQAAHLSSRGLNKILSLNEEDLKVTVEGGITYGELCPWLHEKGYALHNLASLPHISIAGACATATHGSGVNNGNLATSVAAIEIMKADGDTVYVSREDDIFNGTVVNLGSLGVVTKLTLDIQPTFQVRQDNYLDLPESELLNNFEAIMSAGYSVSLFTDYKSDRINQVWIKNKTEDGFDALPDFYGATAADRDIHPILELSAENCTQQKGVPGPWYDRLPHFKIGFTPSSGKELQAEYFVPRKHAVEAYKAIKGLNAHISPLLMISEIRSVASDEFWMSTSYNEPTMVFHFTCLQDWEGLQKVLPMIEAALDPLNGRPHWGKMFTMSPERLMRRYDKADNFKALINEFDPEGKFRNEFIDSYLFSGSQS